MDKSFQGSKSPRSSTGDYSGVFRCTITQILIGLLVPKDWVLRLSFKPHHTKWWCLGFHTVFNGIAQF